MSYPEATGAAALLSAPMVFVLPTQSPQMINGYGAFDGNRSNISAAARLLASTCAHRAKGAESPPPPREPARREQPAPFDGSAQRRDGTRNDPALLKSGHPSRAARSAPTGHGLRTAHCDRIGSLASPTAAEWQPQGCGSAPSLHRETSASDISIRNTHQREHITNACARQQTNVDSARSFSMLPRCAIFIA